MNLKLSKSIKVLVGLISGCVVIIAGTTLYCTVTGSGTGEVLDPPDVDVPPGPSSSPLGLYKMGAVVSNSAPCANIGNKILENYGSAVDAALATMVCDGIGCLQNMGLGGGFLMTIYTKSTRQIRTLNSREVAPSGASVDMFKHDPKLSQLGGLAVAVPGELKGYSEAYRKMGGKAPWFELFRDTIKLCRRGFPVDKHMERSISSNLKDIRNSPMLSSVLLKADGSPPVSGNFLKLPLLADTLQKIGESGGSDILYNGSLTKDFVKDIQEAGGIITEQDMANYSVRWEDAVKVELSDGLSLYSSPPPGSGLVLALILKLLDGLLPSGDTVTDTQRITEAFKMAYARRSFLGDPHFTNVDQVLRDLQDDDYIRRTRSKMWDNATHEDATWYGAEYLTTEDHGTANIVVLAPNGDAVVVTSTVNLIFGSKVMSKSTGIILNNQMDDFSSPDIINYFKLRPSKANLIAPGKRPFSSMCPTIILDSDGNVRLAVGAAGGTKITTATALVTIWNLWYNKTIKEAVDAPRFHHQLNPMTWQYEYGITKDLINGMKSKQHKVNRYDPTWRSAVTGIEGMGRSGVAANADYRRYGAAAGI